MLAEVKKFQNNTIIDDIRIIRAGSLPLQERDMSNSVTNGICIAPGASGASYDV